jgi:hypothetical protein
MLNESFSIIVLLNVICERFGSTIENKALFLEQEVKNKERLRKNNKERIVGFLVNSKLRIGCGKPKKKEGNALL